LTQTSLMGLLAVGLQSSCRLASHAHAEHAGWKHDLGPVRCCAVRAKRHAKLQAAVEEVMTYILRTINEKKDHIPPVTASGILTFPFEIAVAGCARSSPPTQMQCLCVACPSSGGYVFSGTCTVCGITPMKVSAALPPTTRWITFPFEIAVAG
jgi:hypothetical protein